MMLTDADVAEFQALCLKIDGRVLTTDEARTLGTRLVILYRQLCKPFPKDVREVADSPWNRLEAKRLSKMKRALRRRPSPLKRGRGRVKTVRTFQNPT